MAEETPLEAPSAEPVSEATEAPQEQPSTENFVSQNDYQAGLEALEDRLAARLKQSTGDRVKAAVASEIDGRLSGFDETVALLRDHLPEDLDLEAIKERQFIRGLMQQPTSDAPEVEESSPPQPEPPALASVPSGRESEIAAILETHGLQDGHPELLEYAKANEGKPWWEVGAGFDTLAGQIAARSQGNSAGVVPSQGQVAKADLVKEFRQEVDAHLYPRGGDGQLVQGERRSIQRLRTIQQKYVDLGVPIEELDISPKSKAPISIHDWVPPG